ncbi:cell division topological specificity factor MinE [Proteinivorax tanatarense]|uniref:Cell division topological specificity factor n=1 Tax=Proteinivorax tanatarense TaxID=1260629 RepID=A0AAU7VI77_9FIRM
MNLFNRKSKKNSKSIAKDRLKFVLIHDRCKITPDTLEKIRKDMLAVLDKYLEIDTEGTEIVLKDDRSETTLEANIPILKN